MTDILPGTERPGGAVEAEYRKALKSWRRRMRRYFWPMLGIGATLLLAGLLTPHRVWAWVFTSMGAFWLGMFAMARDLPPTPIRNLGQGAEGERDTAKELRRLTSGWTVRHDLNGRYGNLDHVLHGPAGVFILETKAWWGQTLTVSAAGPALRGRDSDWRGRRECDLAKTMKIRAARTNQALRELVKISPWVTPVVVVWVDFPQGTAEHDGVWFVHGKSLCAWLEDRPDRLSEFNMAQLARVL